MEREWWIDGGILGESMSFSAIGLDGSQEESSRYETLEVSVEARELKGLTSIGGAYLTKGGGTEDRVELLP